MGNIDLELLVVEHLQSEAFAHTLAEHISGRYADKLMDEFSNDIADEMAKQVKALTIQYVGDFGIGGDIEQAVKNQFDKISKKELLAIIQDNGN